MTKITENQRVAKLITIYECLTLFKYTVDFSEHSTEQAGHALLKTMFEAMTAVHGGNDYDIASYLDLACSVAEGLKHDEIHQLKQSNEKILAEDAISSSDQQVMLANDKRIKDLRSSQSYANRRERLRKQLYKYKELTND